MLIWISACSPIPSHVPISTTPTATIEDELFCPPPPGWFTYAVRPGDTLRSVAERANSSIGELATANCLNNPRAIGVGMVLYVPQRIG